MQFNFENHSPVYLQLARILEDAIVCGEFEPGQKLPSVRELASLSRTNPNTVAKALQEVEGKGLIETRRTSGKYVSLPATAMEENRKEKACQLCRQFLTDMEKLGYSQQQSLALLKKGVFDASEHSESEKEIRQP